VKCDLLNVIPAKTAECKPVQVHVEVQAAEPRF
jgi:hypothetical protein